VTPLIKHDLIHAKMEHVCNLGALIADDIATDAQCKAFIADPEVVNEFIPESRYTGIPDIHRRSIFHALNSKAVARKYAKEHNTRYEDLNLIMVHLGGGISVGAHRKGKVIDVNNALNGDGPISPERAGTLPSLQLAEMCFSGKFTLPQIKKLICGCGGMAAHLGVTDMRQVMPHAEAGEQPYAEVVSAMAYTIAKEIGSRAVALHGDVDAIIYTGGIAYNKYFTDLISSWVKWIGPIVLMPGEDEMGSLATNALGALNGTLPMQTYAPNDADD
ncbi:MAG: butyrate kinase, partial [Muribaculaceae bacterium]|nr:butyrate kinase [Muribaculaceae bacterium]